MKIRKRYLPPGWYPLDAGDTKTELENMLRDFFSPPTKQALSVIVPHAGWRMSGKTALATLRLLSQDLETIVVVGGHLREGDGIVAATEEGYYTPQGNISADLGLLEDLEQDLRIGVDLYPDNTVEIILPMIRYLFPSVSVLWLRVAPDQDSISLGQSLYLSSTKIGKKIGVVGSTDLTHYGPSYGFTPMGSGTDAISWSRKNDQEFIDSLLKMHPEQALRHATLHQSACSAGGAVAALEFAAKHHINSGTLVEYSSSYEVHPAQDFVGYVGIAYLNSQGSDGAERD